MLAAPVLPFPVLEAVLRLAPREPADVEPAVQADALGQSAARRQWLQHSAFQWLQSSACLQPAGRQLPNICSSLPGSQLSVQREFDSEVKEPLSSAALCKPTVGLTSPADGYPSAYQRGSS